MVQRPSPLSVSQAHRSSGLTPILFDNLFYALFFEKKNGFRTVKTQSGNRIRDESTETNLAISTNQPKSLDISVIIENTNVVNS